MLSPVHYIATDNAALVESAFLHLKEKASSASPLRATTSSGKRWLSSANTRFASWSRRRNIAAWFIRDLRTAPENWQHAQNRLADWLQTLPPQTGIIAVTDARARHVLSGLRAAAYPGAGKLCVIGIDNEELTRYLSRVALSSVAQGTRQMGYRRRAAASTAG